MESETAPPKIPSRRPELADPCAASAVASPGPRAVGRLRVPLGLHHQPWATLYRFPDGRLEWCLRLWQVDRPVTSVVATRTLVDYAHDNGLAELERAIEELLERARREVDDARA
jgi:hypothetical protein